MRLLLDTHALLWWDEDRLPRRLVASIQRADEVYVSAVTAWEIAIKQALGMIAVRGTVAETIADYGFTPSPSPSSTQTRSARSLPIIEIRSTGCWWHRLASRD